MFLLIAILLIGRWLEPSVQTMAVIYLLSIVLLGNYYRVKHFEQIDQGKAKFLSVLVAGIGQIYMKQFITGYLFVGLHIVTIGVAIGANDGALQRSAGIASVLVVILSVIIAHFTADFTNERLKKEAMQKRAVAKYNKLIPLIEEGVLFAPDTNILMHEHLMMITTFYDSDVKFYISKQVVKELDGLKKNEKRSTRKRAQLAFDVLELYQREERIRFIEVPSHNYLHKHKLAGGPDERIIASCLEQVERYKKPMVFLSNDKGARLLARDAGVPIVEF